MRDWSPQDYLKFSHERARPSRDLLHGIPAVDSKLICDLGCGPGNSTALLLDAYPGAHVIGIDNSPAMIAAARAKVLNAEFIEADLTVWQPPRDADLLFSNATFQWLTGHEVIMLRLVQDLKPGGVLAVQMPDNLDEPSHLLMREVAKNARWKDRLAAASAAREPLLAARGYYDLLKPVSADVQIWRTAYHHPLDGVAGIWDFLSSTGLRPFLAPLNESERRAFREFYEASLAGAYPPDEQGQVLLAFPRLFIVAQRQ